MNELQIRMAIDLIKSNGLVEVRVIGDKIYSGYFRNVDNLIKQLRPHANSNIYFVMNEISEACYDRKQQEVIQISKTTTSDSDITERKWLLIDIDSERETGVGATDEQKKNAAKAGREVFKFLRDIGFSKPISADSGNGIHLLYPISLANTPDNTQLVKDVLSVLDMYFSNGDAKIDTSVFNASRITKLYGTFARKGKSTKERPHRESKILDAPEEIKVNEISLLRKVADLLPKQEEKSRWNNYGADRFDVDNFISKHGIKVRSKSNYSGGEKYVLEHCVFDHSHKGKDAAIFKLSSGAIGYKCFHNSCSEYSWRDVRKKFEPNAYEKHTPSFSTSPIKRKPQVEDERGGKFLQMNDIKDIDRSQLVYIKTHFKELDKKMIGFLKGELTVWSGVNASGKSSVLSQLALNAINDKFKVLMFSGELTPQRVKGWMLLQAAGRQFTKASDECENFFEVPKSKGKLISEWMNDSFFLYNNDYGNKHNQLLADLTARLKQGDIDMVILDNIMSIDIDELDKDVYARQKKAVEDIKKIAEKYSVHIHLVAHPRKTIRLLRKEDISGSGNISNIAQNVIIIHRVSNDFIRYSKEYFGEWESEQYVKFNNVIEVCKNRDLGVMDYIVGLYFEKESKRFLNEPSENIVYGWQEALNPTLVDFSEPIKNEDFLSQTELDKVLTELPF